MNVGYLWLIALAGIFVLQGTIADVYSDYEKCRNEENFGQPTGALVCDYGHTLNNQTIAKLESLLEELQKKITCECPQGCNRSYTGLLHVTSTEAIKESGVPLNDTAKKIFEDAKLSDHKCENGLLIIYNRDTQQLATYRGEKKFAQLDSDQVHKLIAKTHNQSDTTALETPEEQPLSMERSEVQRSDVWPSMLGLVVALVLFLVIVAVLLAFLLARFCPCCRRGSGKKDKYYVNPVPSAKASEPIYIYTPPSERSPRALPPPHSDPEIYSTAYSGTPLPPPPSVFDPSKMPPPAFFDPSRMPPFPPRSRTSSRPITPSSTHRTKIHPISKEGSFKTPETPQSKRDIKVSHTESVSSKQKQGTHPRSKQPSVSTEQPTSPVPPPVPPHGDSSAPRSPKSPRLRGTASPDSPDPQVLASSELPFLDPLRKLEVQTKEDYIY
uniref:Uncharacterized protein n=1 Tax=Acrobeloides nanus TaxID=290746 RepID=A0A914BVY5_9BILA